jgi:hypothetical protein
VLTSKLYAQVRREFPISLVNLFAIKALNSTRSSLTTLSKEEISQEEMAEVVNLSIQVTTSQMKTTCIFTLALEL